MCAKKHESRQAMLAITTRHATANPVAEPQGEAQMRGGKQVAVDSASGEGTKLRKVRPNESPIAVPQGETQKGESEWEETGWARILGQTHYTAGTSRAAPEQGHHSAKEMATAQPAKLPNATAQQSIRIYGATDAFCS